MTWAAVAASIVLLLVIGGAVLHRRRGGDRLMGPDGFRHALDAMSPNADHRERTIERSAAPSTPLPTAIEPRPRGADDATDQKEHPRS